jgi:hypothetical protein
LKRFLIKRRNNKPTKQYLLLFRANYHEFGFVSDEKMQEWNDNWMVWLKGLVAKNALAEGGNHLDSGGKVLRGKGSVNGGPFLEVKESILGYLLINAESYDTVVELAKDCPRRGRHFGRNTANWGIKKSCMLFCNDNVHIIWSS